MKTMIGIWWIGLLAGILAIGLVSGCQRETPQGNEGKTPVSPAGSENADILTAAKNLQRPAPWPALDPERYRTVREQWGIEPIFLRLSAHDQMLDFRYRVADVEKAAPLMLRTVDRTLIDQATGRKLIVPAPPKVGRLRQTTLRPEEGRVYFMLFGNPGGSIRRGARMTVVIGDCRLEDLVVQ
jgi:hypothetical protein